VNLTDVKLSLVKYKIATLRLTIPKIKEPFIVETIFINNFSIEKDYDNYYFPYFQLSVNVPAYIYRAMKKNNLNIYAYMDLQSGYFKDVNVSNEKPAFKSYTKGNFYVFMEDMSPDVTENEQIAIEKDAGTYKKGSSLSDTVKINLLLYHDSTLFNSKTIVNNVLTSATLVDALAYVLNKAKITKVLLSPPNNYHKYSEFILTPVTALEQLERICNEYGIHKKGTLIFFDLTYTYIIDRSPKCSAYQKNEYKTTHLMSSTNKSLSSGQKKGCYKNAKEKYYMINLNSDNISFKSLGELNNQQYGNTFTTVDSSTGKVSTTDSKAVSAKKSLSKTSRVIVQDSGDSTSKALANSLKEDSKIAVLGFSYVDLDMLAPNKQFIITIDDSKLKKYNGKYRITKLIAAFEKEGNFFIPSVTAEFKG